jgi:hypothetical protein
MSDLGIKRETIGIAYYCDIRLLREEFSEAARPSDDGGLD